MTSIGRFSLQSETITNPSLPTFFVALAGPPVNSQQVYASDDSSIMSVNEFIDLWNRKQMSNRHPRFHASVNATANASSSANQNLDFEYNTPNLYKYVSETLPYYVPRLELQRRIEQMLCNTQTLPLNEKLWEAKVTSGPLGSSGAISKKKQEMIWKQFQDSMSNQSFRDTIKETVILFRSHHCIGDGVSLSAALMDLSDESNMFHKKIHFELRKRKKKRLRQTLLQKLLRFWKGLVWFWLGSIKAICYQGYLALMTPVHPFQFIFDKHSTIKEGTMKSYGRSVSWCDAALLKDVNEVAKIIYSKATINDLFITCVAGAIRRQIMAHKNSQTNTPDTLTTASSTTEATPSHVNVVIPVHLMGGVLPPGHSLSNKIGAMTARVPTIGSNALEETSQTLSNLKKSPTAILSHLAAKFVSMYLPSSLAKDLFTKSNNNAAFVLSNVRGPPHAIHWNGREVISMGGFVPLSPGVYVGVAVQSYNGIVSLTVNADKRVVPDADLFLKWVLEEYSILCKMAEKKQLQKNK